MVFKDECIVDSEELDVSTQFLQMQSNHLVELQEHFERYCNILTVFGFISAEFYLNLIKSCLSLFFVNERDIGPTVIKKANQFVFFNIGDTHFLILWHFLVSFRCLDSFCKIYKTNQTKRFSPNECSVCTEKLNKKNFLPYDSFFNIFSATVNPSKKITKTLKALFQVLYPESKT